MFKQTIIFTAIAGLVFALAPAAQAVPITVMNFSFESPDWGNYGYSTDDWTVTDVGGGYIEGRTKARATDGHQVIALSPPGGVISQVIGTVADLPAFPRYVLTFDARFGMEGWGFPPESSPLYFEAYFTVNGMKDSGDDFTSSHGTGRLLRSYEEISNDTGANMDTFSATLNTWALSGPDEVAIVFTVGPVGLDYVPTAGDVVVLDNVRIDAVPEPATLALLGIGGLGLLIRRRRRG